MPELPEVETIRRELEPQIVGATITDATAHPSDKFQPARDAVGGRFTASRRRGKYLLLELHDERELVIHLGMTGQLHVAASATSAHDARPIDPYTRAAWHLDDGRTLVFRDVRRFGRIRVVPTGDYEGITTLAALGPEPLGADFTAEGLWQAMRTSKRRVKTQLLSQRPVAGVGNIYADEALWRAQIYPAARSLTRPQATRLHRSIIDVLQTGVDNGGTTLRDYRTVAGEEGSNQHHLDCYGRGGEPCPRCAAPLRSQVWDARTTTFCPNCQRR